jgi:hypothetical protein
LNFYKRAAAALKIKKVNLGENGGGGKLVQSKALSLFKKLVLQANPEVSIREDNQELAVDQDEEMLFGTPEK